MSLLGNYLILTKLFQKYPITLLALYTQKKYIVWGSIVRVLQLVAQSRSTDVAEERHGEAHSQDLSTINIKKKVRLKNFNKGILPYCHRKKAS